MKLPTPLEFLWRTRSTEPLLAWLAVRVPVIPAAVWRMVMLLVFASGATCLVWALRVVLSGHLRHLFLPWNLFLAWLPLVLAVGSLECGRRIGWRSWQPWLLATAWLLFFPNAPYIFTDLVHLRGVQDQRYWIDLIMILLFAWPGFLAGCLSLRLFHAKLAGHIGGFRAWACVGLTCGLAGVGVYIGRFLRWNSWDVVVDPLGLGFDLLGFFGHPITHPAYRFTALFGLLLFIGYVTLHALTQFPPACERTTSGQLSK